MRNPTEYRRVRNHIINFLSTGSGALEDLPSARKIATELAVSHTTVLRTLQRLKHDGFVATQSRQRSPQMPNGKILGVIFGDGQNAYDNLYFVQNAAALGGEYTRRAENFYLHTLYIEPEEFIPSVVRQNKLWGLVYCGCRPQPEIRQALRVLRESGLPTGSLYAPVDGVSGCIARDEFLIGEMCRPLLAAGRRRILVALSPNDSVPATRAAVDAVCAAAGVPTANVALMTIDAPELCPRLREMRGFGMDIDGLVFPMPFNGIYHELHATLDEFSDCEIICYDTAIRDNMRYNGMTLRFDLAAACRWLVDELLRQETAAAPSARQEEIPYAFWEYHNGQIVTDPAAPRILPVAVG